jgi:non-heme chloroperoxidase
MERRSQMTKKTLWVGLATLLGTTLYAQDITGDWQGTLAPGAEKLRMVMHIAKDSEGAWKATLFSIDQGADGIVTNSVKLQGPSLKVTFDQLRGTFEGKVSTEGTSIQGTWSQGPTPLPLDLVRATKETAWRNTSAVQFVTVENNVRLEVIDWGGSGRSLVLLAGLGNTAHTFDKFAPKLTPKYHVYGITRRGFGESSSPASGYSADRLGDDVLAVMDSLKLTRPILVGHSIAGEELSSIGTRHPEKVAGLIYLDAGYAYAYYDSSRGDLLIDSLDLQKKLDQLLPGKGPQDQTQLLKDLLQVLPQFEKDVQERLKELESAPAPQQQTARQVSPAVPLPPQAILAGQQKYTDIRVPILAIYAVPHDRGAGALKDPVARAAAAAAEAADLARTGAQAKAFEKGVPSARVVRIAHANHFVFLSNESDVLREMNAFLESLP